MNESEGGLFHGLQAQLWLAPESFAVWREYCAKLTSDGYDTLESVRDLVRQTQPQERENVFISRYGFKRGHMAQLLKLAESPPARPSSVPSQGAMVLDCLRSSITPKALKLLLEAVVLCRGSYEKTLPELKAWLEEEAQLQWHDARQLAFAPQCRFNAQQYFVTHSSTAVWVVFRGSYSAQDWLTNLSVWTSSTIAGNVHSEFYERAKSVDVIQILAIAAHSSKPVIFTGHSLGGAVAVLCALEAMQHYANLGGKPEGDSETAAQRLLRENILCITFGAPYVGDLRLQNKITQCGWHRLFINVVNNDDCVPGLLNLSATTAALRQVSDLYMEQANQVLTGMCNMFDAASLSIAQSPKEPAPQAIVTQRKLVKVVSETWTYVHPNRKHPYPEYAPIGVCLVLQYDGDRGTETRLVDDLIDVQKIHSCMIEHVKDKLISSYSVSFLENHKLTSYQRSLWMVASIRLLERYECMDKTILFEDVMMETRRTVESLEEMYPKIECAQAVRGGQSVQITVRGERLTTCCIHSMSVMALGHTELALEFIGATSRLMSESTIVREARANAGSLDTLVDGESIEVKVRSVFSQLGEIPPESNASCLVSETLPNGSTFYFRGYSVEACVTRRSAAHLLLRNNVYKETSSVLFTTIVAKCFAELLLLRPEQGFESVNAASTVASSNENFSVLLLLLELVLGQSRKQRVLEGMAKCLEDEHAYEKLSYIREMFQADVDDLTEAIQAPILGHNRLREASLELVPLAVTVVGILACLYTGGAAGYVCAAIYGFDLTATYLSKATFDITGNYKQTLVFLLTMFDIKGVFVDDYEMEQALIALPFLQSPERVTDLAKAVADGRQPLSLERRGDGQFVDGTPVSMARLEADTSIFEEKLIPKLLAACLIHRLRRVVHDTTAISVFGTKKAGKSSVVEDLWRLLSGAAADQSTRLNVHHLINDLGNRLHIYDCGGFDDARLDGVARNFAEISYLTQFTIVMFHVKDRETDATMDALKRITDMLQEDSRQLVIFLNMIDLIPDLWSMLPRIKEQWLQLLVRKNICCIDSRCVYFTAARPFHGFCEQAAAIELNRMRTDAAETILLLPDMKQVIAERIVALTGVPYDETVRAYFPVAAPDSAL